MEILKNPCFHVVISCTYTAFPGYHTIKATNGMVQNPRCTLSWKDFLVSLLLRLCTKWGKACVLYHCLSRHWPCLTMAPALWSRLTFAAFLEPSSPAIATLGIKLQHTNWGEDTDSVSNKISKVKLMKPLCFIFKKMLLRRYYTDCKYPWKSQRRTYPSPSQCSRPLRSSPVVILRCISTIYCSWDGREGEGR